MKKMKKEERMALIEKGLNAAKYHLPGVVAKDLVESLGRQRKGGVWEIDVVAK